MSLLLKIILLNYGSNSNIVFKGVLRGDFCTLKVLSDKNVYLFIVIVKIIFLFGLAFMVKKLKMLKVFWLKSVFKLFWLKS